MRSPFLPKKVALFLFASVLAATSAGCESSVSSDYAVTVTWLINGRAPSHNLCKEKAVDRIRFTVLGPGKERSLEGACDEHVRLDDGFDYGGFLSTLSFDYGVSYDYRVEMLDVNGRALKGLSYKDTFVVQAEDDQPWVLTPLELFSPAGKLSGISAEWTIAGGKANAMDCQKLGAVKVSVDVASSTDQEFDDYSEMLSADCAEGIAFSDGAVLAEGEYNVRYVALDAQGEVVQEVISEQLYVVDAKGTLDVETIDFNL